MKRSKFFFFLSICLLFAAGNALGQSVTTGNVKTPGDGDPAGLMEKNGSLIKIRIRKVYDGDTVGVEGKDKKIHPIRLRGVDAPENGQEHASEAMKHLSEMIDGKVVTLIVNDRDSQNRYIGNVYRDGQDVGLKQIEAGMAWHFKKFSYSQTSEDRKRYAQAETKARNERLGLWKDNAPIPPWEFAIGGSAENRAASTGAESATPPTAAVENPPAKQNAASGKTYVLGPRGGCYYVNESGAKVYVKDKTLCGKP